MTDAGLAQLKELGQLRCLDVTSTQVTDAGLKHLQGFNRLQVLYLGHTHVTDAGLEYLKGLTNLYVLVLAGTNVTGAGVKELQAALPECQIILSPPPKSAPRPTRPSHPYAMKVLFRTGGLAAP